MSQEALKARLTNGISPKKGQGISQAVHTLLRDTIGEDFRKKAFADLKAESQKLIMELTDEISKSNPELCNRTKQSYKVNGVDYNNLVDLVYTTDNLKLDNAKIDSVLLKNQIKLSEKKVGKKKADTKKTEAPAPAPKPAQKSVVSPPATMAPKPAPAPSSCIDCHTNTKMQVPAAPKTLPAAPTLVPTPKPVINPQPIPTLTINPCNECHDDKKIKKQTPVQPQPAPAPIPAHIPAPAPAPAHIPAPKLNTQPVPPKTPGKVKIDRPIE